MLFTYLLAYLFIYSALPNPTYLLVCLPSLPCLTHLSLTYLALLAHLLVQLCLAPLSCLSVCLLISSIYYYYNYGCKEFEIFFYSDVMN